MDWKVTKHPTLEQNRWFHTTRPLKLPNKFNSPQAVYLDLSSSISRKNTLEKIHSRKNASLPIKIKWLHFISLSIYDVIITLENSTICTSTEAAGLVQSKVLDRIELAAIMQNIHCRWDRWNQQKYLRIHKQKIVKKKLRFLRFLIHRHTTSKKHKASITTALSPQITNAKSRQINPVWKAPSKIYLQYNLDNTPSEQLLSGAITASLGQDCTLHSRMFHFFINFEKSLVWAILWRGFGYK